MFSHIKRERENCAHSILQWWAPLPLVSNICLIPLKCSQTLEMNWIGWIFYLLVCFLFCLAWFWSRFTYLNSNTSAANGRGRKRGHSIQQTYECIITLLLMHKNLFHWQWQRRRQCQFLVLYTLYSIPFDVYCLLYKCTCTYMYVCMCVFVDIVYAFLELIVISKYIE